MPRLSRALPACLLLLGLPALAACVAPPPTHATSGSRADAVVTVSHGPAPLVPALPTWVIAQMNGIAAQKCGVWGYGGADMFGGHTTVCALPSGGVCHGWRYDVEYQCTGRPS